MSALLTHDQVELLRAKGTGWPMAALIARTEDAIQQEKQGAHGGCGGAWWFDTDAQGVHGTRSEDLQRISYSKRGREHLVHVTWPMLRRAVGDLPRPLVAAVADAYDAWQTHYQRHMVRPYAPSLSRVPWVEEDPHLLRAAELRMRMAASAALDALAPVELAEQLDLFGDAA